MGREQIKFQDESLQRRTPDISNDIHLFLQVQLGDGTSRKPGVHPKEKCPDDTETPKHVSSGWAEETEYYHRDLVQELSFMRKFYVGTLRVKKLGYEYFRDKQYSST